MPDPHRLQRELEEALAQPRYQRYFDDCNRTANPDRRPGTPRELARKTVDWIMLKTPFHEPVKVEHWNGGCEFYRSYDDIKAPAYGRSWFERDVMQAIWSAVKRKWQGDARKTMLMEFLRSANFILPDWNRMTHMARMTVQVTDRIVVVRGRGTWRAMQTRGLIVREDDIRTAEDVITKLKIMPIPGTFQCVIPLYLDDWVKPVGIDALPG